MSVLRCSECGEPISVRLSARLDRWMAWCLTLLVPVYALMLLAVVVLLVGAMSGNATLAGGAGTILAIGLVSFLGLRALVTRRMSRVGVLAAWLAAMLPMLLCVGGCVLGIVLPVIG